MLTRECMVEGVCNILKSNVLTDPCYNVYFLFNCIHEELFVTFHLLARRVSLICCILFSRKWLEHYRFAHL